MTEWLAEPLDLRPGMRVLDLGCGRTLSSVFLHGHTHSSRLRRFACL
jgi:cyclopropane fatty-acyl-phospholipid synthase-like methyltransferase